MIITSRGTIDAGSLGRIPTEKGGVVRYGSKTRTAVMGADGVIGYTEEFASPPSIKVTLIDTNQTDKEKLLDFVNETIIYRTNNGQQFTLTGAVVANELELNIDDGKMEIEFHGIKLI